MSYRTAWRLVSGDRGAKLVLRLLYSWQHLSNFQLSFHPLLSMTRQRPEAFVAIDGEGSSGRGHEIDHHALPRAYVLVDQEFLDDEVVGYQEGFALQDQLHRFSRLYNQVARLVRIAVQNDGGALDTISSHWHDKGRLSIRRFG